MDFWRTVLVIFRRWYISVPAFFATLVLAGAAYSAVPVQYQSGSVLVLTTPLAGGTQATDARTPDRAHQPAADLRPQPRPDGLDRHPADEQLGDRARPGRRPGRHHGLPGHQRQHQPGAARVGTVPVRPGHGPHARGCAGRRRRRSPPWPRRSSTSARTSSSAPQSTHITVQVVVPPTAGQPLLGSSAAGVRRRRRAGRPDEPRGRLRLREPDDPPSAAPSGTRAGGHTCRHGADDTPDDTGDGVAMTLLRPGRPSAEARRRTPSRGLAGPRTPPRSWGSSSRSSSCCRRGWSSTTCRSPCQRRRWSRSGSAPCGSAPR